MEDSASPDAHPKTSVQAIWSLVLGILSIPCLWILGSIPAIILGILALRNIDRSPDTLKGRGLAIAGIATGAAGVVMGFLSMAILIPAFAAVNAKVAETRYLDHARKIIVACHDYADDNDNMAPPTLDALVTEGYLAGPGVLKVINAETAQAETFQFMPGFTFPARDSLMPLIYSPPIHGEMRLIGFYDGSVQRVSETEFQALLSRKAGGQDQDPAVPLE